VVLADLAGDVPAALGLPEPDGPGLAGWLGAGEDTPADALARLEVPGPAGLAVLPLGGAPGLGAGPGAGHRGELLAAALATDPRPVVVDCGSSPAAAAAAVAAGATVSLLVTRACYLSLRRALAAAVRPSAVVLVDEPGRALGVDDIEQVLGVPVRARVAHDASVARAVDAGLLSNRLPRGLERALRHAA
jgi:hypothetical protein